MAYIPCAYCDMAPRQKDFSAHVEACRREFLKAKRAKEMEVELERLETIVLTLKPGDVLGLRSKAPITADTAARIKYWAESVLPEGVKAMVFGPDIEPVVIRKEDA